MHQHLTLRLIHEFWHGTQRVRFLQSLGGDRCNILLPDTVEAGRDVHACISIRCDTAVGNERLRAGKAPFVPSNGIILATRTVSFTEGETVFNVLQRETRAAGIQMEFSSNPMFNSVYIEGINNLYEFDCGELSGWMYKVNGWFPNYGCSQYMLQPGDVIEWVYTCDLGSDVGGGYAAGTQG